VASELDRRTFLRRSGAGAAGLGLVLGGGSLLAACGDDDTDDSSSSDGGGSTSTTVTYQLSWVKNAEFAGNWIADDTGLYKAAGIDKVTFLAGGPGVQQEQVVASGKALLGISGTDLTASAINKGLPLVALGALFQKNPFSIVSLASNPIADAESMKGKKIGVQDVNLPIWNAFLKAAKIDPSSVTVVPVQFDPQGLVNGEAEGWFSFTTNEPNALREKGIDVAEFLLADAGYPMATQITFTTTDNLKNDRDTIKKVMLADIQGWRESLKDPTKGADLAVDKYGKDLGLEKAAAEQESKTQNTLILTDDTKANGIYTVSDELLDETLQSLGYGDIKIDAAKLFDFSVLEEIYEENPDLKTSPV